MEGISLSPVDTSHREEESSDRFRILVYEHHVSSCKTICDYGQKLTRQVMFEYRIVRTRPRIQKKPINEGTTIVAGRTTPPELIVMTAIRIQQGIAMCGFKCSQFE